MTDDSQGEDVKAESTSTEATGETDTSTAETSGGKETDQKSEESSSAEGTEDLGGKFVPYDRFREVNEKAKRVAELEAKIQELEGTKSDSTAPAPGAPGPMQKEQIKSAIKEMGFVPKEEVQEMLRQKDDDDALKQELTRLEGVYDGSDGKPKFDKDKVIKFALDRQIGDPEAAYKILNEKALTDWQIQQAIDKSRGVKTEVSTGTGGEVGPTDDELKAAALKGDSKAKDTLLARITQRTLHK